jgi:hypothetical protein
MGLGEYAANKFYLDVKNIDSLFLYNLQIKGDGTNTYYYYRPLWTYGSTSACKEFSSDYISRCEMQSLPMWSMHATGYITGSFKDIIYGSIYIRVSDPENSE